MTPIKLRVPREAAANLADDLTAWTASSGIDQRLISFQPGAAATPGSPNLYWVYESESLFAQFPKWRAYIEH